MYTVQCSKSWQFLLYIMKEYCQHLQTVAVLNHDGRTQLVPQEKNLMSFYYVMDVIFPSNGIDCENPHQSPSMETRREVEETDRQEQQVEQPRAAFCPLA